jgi:AraC family transcriptional regulator
MTTALKNYHARMQRVLDHIERNLDGNLDLDELSSVAAFSKFHFHRQFTATFGLSVHRYVQLSRMKRASYQLAYRDAISVTEIAMDAGYEAPDAFARAFRQRFEQSPTQFRKSPDWDPWLMAFGPLKQARNKLMQNPFTLDQIEIRTVASTPVAIMEHRGHPNRIGNTIQRFIAWRKANGLSPKTNPTFNIFHSDPRTTPPEDYRLDLCVGTDQSLHAKGEVIETGLIPGGRCAVLRVAGNTDDLESAAVFLYRDWLPESGEEVGDFPLYCQRLSFFPEVSESEAVAELFLPLK